MIEVLLLSGGMDSAALAAWRRPAACLFIDYGQRPANGEKRSSAAVCDALGLELWTLAADCSAAGAGSLADDGATVPGAPSAEWWPFRNQLLVTLGAAFAVRAGQATKLILGAVAEDGGRHADGRPEFVDALDRLLGLQEGGTRLAAPAIGMTTAELVTVSGISDDVLGWTHSCHVSPWACGSCAGCTKRHEVLGKLGRL